MKRTTLACATYWTLFIIAPVAVCFYLLGPSASAAGKCVAILLCFALSANTVSVFGKRFGKLIHEKL